MKKFMKEFKEFISRGNVMDMAVGIIIGGAFTAIVTSLVNDVVMPAIGILLAGVNFKDLKWVITPASGDIPEAAIYYGSFIQNVVNFLIVALVVFSIVKAINSIRKKEEEAPPAPPKPSDEAVLLGEIKELLEKKQ